MARRNHSGKKDAWADKVSDLVEGPTVEKVEAQGWIKEALV